MASRFFFLLSLALFPIIAQAEPLARVLPSSAIREQILEQLDQQRDLGTYDIAVEVRSGIATIEGKVASKEVEQRIIGIAAQTKGIRDVRNYLAVTGEQAIPPTSKVVEDITSQLRAQPNLKQFEVNVRAKSGVVDLDGKVQTDEDRTLVARIASQAEGVREVHNNLSVANPITDSELQARVLAALKEAGDIDLDRISFVTRNGVVNFKGTVDNHREIDKALAITLMVEGVKDVSSQVTIGERKVG